MPPKADQEIHRARLIYRRPLHPKGKGLDLFRFQILDHPTYEFSAGQFVDLALEGVFETNPKKADKLAWRSYSIASAPSDREYLEFFIRLKTTPDKFFPAFTPFLFQMKEGDELNAVPPKGKFTFDHLTSNRVLLIASGTGLAPFRAWVRDLYLQNKKGVRKYAANPLQIALASGASFSWDLGYREELETIAAESRESNFDFTLTYVPTISRPHIDTEWKGVAGRVENALKDGAIEEAMGWKAEPGTCTVYVCGFNDTVNNVRAMLKERNFDLKDLHFEYYG